MKQINPPTQMFIEKFLIYKSPEKSPVSTPEKSPEDKAREYIDSLNGAKLVDLTEQSGDVEITEQQMQRLFGSYMPILDDLPENIKGLTQEDFFGLVYNAIRCAGGSDDDFKLITQMDYSSIVKILNQVILPIYACPSIQVFNDLNELKATKSEQYATQRLLGIMDTIHFHELNQNEVIGINALYQKLKSSNATGTQYVSGVEVSNYVNDASELSGLILSNKIAVETLLTLLRKCPQLEENVQKAQIDTAKSSIVSQTAQLYQWAQSEVLMQYRLIDLLKVKDLKQSPIYTQPLLRSVWMSALVRSFYKGTDLGKGIENIQATLDNNPKDEVALARWLDLLTNFKTQFLTLERVSRASIIAKPFQAMNLVLDQLEEASASNFYTVQSSAYLGLKVASNSELLSKPAAMALGAAALSSGAKESSLFDLAAGLSAMQTKLFDAFDEDVKTKLKLKDKADEQFHLLPFVIRSMIKETDFQHKTLQDLQEYLNGSNTKFLSGDSILLRHLRESSASDPNVIILKSLFRAILKSIQEKCPQLAPSDSAGKVALSDMMLGWLINDDLFKTITDLDSDITEAYEKNPQAPQPVKDTLDASEEAYVRTLRGSDLLRDEVKRLSDQQIFANYNYQLDFTKHTVASVSSIYGPLFAKSQLTYSAASPKFYDIEKDFAVDAMGNRYADFKVRGTYKTVENILDYLEGYHGGNNHGRLVYGAQLGTEMHFGLVLEPKSKRDNPNIRDVAAAPINGSVAAHAVIRTETMAQYSPEVRILDELVGVPGQSLPAFSSTPEMLSERMSQLGAQGAQYLTQLQEFYKAYKDQSLYNSSWHNHIQRALFQFLSNPTVSVEDKQSKLSELQSLSGFRLYLEAAKLALIPKSKQNPSNQVQTRANLLMQELQKTTDDLRVDGVTIDHDYLSHQTMYLRLLLGYIYGNITEKAKYDRVMLMIERLSPDMKTNIIDQKLDARQQLIQYYKVKLHELVGKPLDLKTALKDMPKRGFETLSTQDDYGKVAYRKLEGGQITMDGIHYIQAKGNCELTLNDTELVEKMYVLGTSGKVFTLKKPKSGSTAPFKYTIVAGERLYFEHSKGAAIDASQIKLEGQMRIVKGVIEKDVSNSNRLISGDLPKGSRSYLMGEKTHMHVPANLDLDKQINVKFVYGKADDFKPSGGSNWYTKAATKNYILVTAPDYDPAIVESVMGQLKLFGATNSIGQSLHYVGTAEPAKLGVSGESTSKVTAENL